MYLKFWATWCVPCRQQMPFAFRAPSMPRPTVLVFISPWCESYLATTRPAISAGCRRAREQIDQLVQDQRVRWIGTASGLWARKQDLSKYRDSYKIGIPLTLDESGALFRASRSSLIAVS